MGISINYLPGVSNSHEDWFTRNLLEVRDGVSLATARGYASARRLTSVSPAAHVVSTTIAKLHARIRNDDEDLLWPIYLGAAERRVEHDTGVALVLGTFEITIKQFPSFRLPLRLPIWPVLDVLSFSHFSSEGEETAAASPIPYLLTNGRPQDLALPTISEAWPTDLRRSDPGVLEVTAGHAEGTVPEDLVLAVLMLFAHSARVREPIVTGAGITIDKVPVAGYKDTIRPWVLPGV